MPVMGKQALMVGRLMSLTATVDCEDVSDLLNLEEVVRWRKRGRGPGKSRRRRLTLAMQHTQTRSRSQRRLPTSQQHNPLRIA